MLVAIEHLGGVGVGVTAPQFFRADDEKTYVVKFQDDRLNSRVAVSELFAAKIGAIMGLCFPPSDIIELDEQLISGNPDLMAVGINAGRHFASRFLDGAEYVGKKGLCKADNITDMAGVVLFDHLFHNADRAKNPRNLLLRLEVETCKIYAIDNSHLFRSSRWTVDTFQRLGEKITIYFYQHYRKLLRDVLSADDFLPYTERLKTVSDKQIDCIVQDIPMEWLPCDLERQALATFAKTRIAMAEEILDKILRQIPKSRGGRGLSLTNKDVSST